MRCYYESWWTVPESSFPLIGWRWLSSVVGCQLVLGSIVCHIPLFHLPRAMGLTCSTSEWLIRWLVWCLTTPWLSQIKNARKKKRWRIEVNWMAYEVSGVIVWLCLLVSVGLVAYHGYAIYGLDSRGFASLLFTSFTSSLCLLFFFVARPVLLTRSSRHVIGLNSLIVQSYVLFCCTPKT